MESLLTSFSAIGLVKLKYWSSTWSYIMWSKLMLWLWVMN